MANDFMIVEARKKIEKALGVEQTKRYYKYLKQWFSRKITKDEFDQQTRQLFPLDRVYLHNEFIVCLLRKCSIDTPSAPAVKDCGLRALKRAIVKAKRHAAAMSQEASGVRAFEPAPQLPTSSDVVLPSVTRFREPQLSTQQGYLLPTSLLHARMLVSAWENGLQGIDSDVPLLINSALHTFLKNLLASVIKLKNSNEGHLRQSLPSSRCRLVGEKLELQRPHIASTDNSMFCNMTAKDVLDVLKVYRSSIPQNAAYLSTVEKLSLHVK